MGVVNQVEANDEQIATIGAFSLHGIHYIDSISAYYG